MINIPVALEKLKNLSKSSEDEKIKIELNTLHSADLAEIFENISQDERLQYFEYLDEEKAANLLEELNPQIQVELLSSIGEEKAANIIMEMPRNSVADVLGDLSDEETELYLAKLPIRVSSQIRELLSYEEDTAGGIMNSEVLTVNQNMTVKETLEFIRTKAETSNIDFYYIYVVDKTNHLLGVLSLRSLITSSPYTKVEKIMTTEVIKVNVADDQEITADTLMKYGFLAMPVVDDYGKLKGIVTWDDAQEITEEETTEEIYASSGIISTNVIDEDEILSGHIMQAVKARTPWLLITLVGEFFAVNVANHFDHTLHVLPIIAIFMPLLAGLGGNIGTQSITLMVRGLSTGQINLNFAVHHIFRELKVGLIIGLMFGLVVTFVTWSWKGNLVLGTVVGLSMLTNMTLATILGTMTPFILKRFNIDPAVASGPFIATTIDVLGLAVYFSLVTLSLKFLL
ncbi:MAG: magnesium transporter [bacterium]